MRTGYGLMYYLLENDDLEAYNGHKTKKMFEFIIPANQTKTITFSNILPNADSGSFENEFKVLE